MNSWIVVILEVVLCTTERRILPNISYEAVKSFMGLSFGRDQFSLKHRVHRASGHRDRLREEATDGIDDQ